MGGRTVFEYDLPSSLFGQFGDERVTEVGGKLDMELETALRARVAEPGEVVVLASQSLRDLIAMQTSLGDTVLRPKNLAHI